jgi:ketol-acid reductoisomerase
MKIYRDEDADLKALQDRRIAVIGYGNQGRSQALNLRDAGMDVVIGNRSDAYGERAAAEGFTVLAISEAVARADVVMLLIPDEVMDEVFEAEVVRYLRSGSAIVFASGYTVAFGLIEPPSEVDVVLLAPRMIGAGVRDLYAAGRGFPSFIGVKQDASGEAKTLVLALAKAIGSTRMGVVEVTFAQEAELDLFTEQCFGPAFGAVLTSAVNLLVDEGYPPEAVLLELYMSGELAYTFGKIAELGTVEQAALHSTTSQYGSMSRGIRFQVPALRKKMRKGLEEIRSGAFAREWAEEQADGSPTLEMLREQARSMPMYEMEQALLAQLESGGHYMRTEDEETDETRPSGRRSTPASGGLLDRLKGVLQGERVLGEGPAKSAKRAARRSLTASELEDVLEVFVGEAVDDPALQAFAEGRDLMTSYIVPDVDLAFYLGFHEGEVTGGLGDPPSEVDVRLFLDAVTLDGMLSGTLNPVGAALSGDIIFEGEARPAMSVQRVQGDLIRLYKQARAAVIAS